jgi:chorismate mutase / prephenate dehydrogenase
VRRMFRSRGLTIKESTPEEHDQAMSIVQVLVHFSTEVIGNTLAHLSVSIKDTLQFTSPIYLMELLMTARHFAQSPDLYADIEMSNPATPQVTEIFAKTAQQMHNLVTDKDHAGFVRMFQEVRDYFGGFTDYALEQSSFLIDRLVERD